MVRRQVALTLSNEVILGVSIDDPQDEPEVDPKPREDSRLLMADLAARAGARHAWIGENEPPTLDTDREQPWRWSLA